MTSLALLFWITLGIALQLALWLGVHLWHHWRSYQALGQDAPQSQPPEVLPGGSAEGAAWTGMRPFRVDRRVIEDAAGSICSFYLVPQDGKPLPEFLPGQYLTFRLDVTTPEGQVEPLTRCYSLSEAPGKPSYRISIKRIPAPSGSDSPPGRSSNHFHDHVHIGSSLQVRAPAGHFYLDHGQSPVVLIAGGIGITPLLSMLNWCLAQQPEREIWLFYGVTHGREVIMKEHLDALAASHPHFHLWRCFSNPLPDDQPGRDYHHQGRVDISLLRLKLPLKQYHFYICGPSGMMETLVPGLRDWGVADSQLHYEAFGPASIPARPAQIPPPSGDNPSAATSAIRVNFSTTGSQQPWQPAFPNLLEFAEHQGIRLNSGCRAGICGGCQTVLRAGEVHYSAPPDFDPAPGTCLPCVCTPKTSITLEA